MNSAKQKPAPRRREPIMDFHDMIEFVEKKHEIRTRDVHGLHGPDSHYVAWQREANDPQPNDGYYPDVSGKGESKEDHMTVVRDGARRKATREEYENDFKLIHEHYQRYKDWCVENPPPPYLDYWHWLLAGQFHNVRNPCTQHWDLREILNDEDTPPWVREITQKVYDEFEHVLVDGAVNVEISW